MTWTKNYLNQLDEGNQKAPWMRSVNNQSFQQNSSDLLLNDFLPSIKANLVFILIQSQSLTSMLNLLEAPHLVNLKSYITRHTWLGHACILPNNLSDFYNAKMQNSWQQYSYTSKTWKPTQRDRGRRSSNSTLIWPRLSTTDPDQYMVIIPYRHI